MKLPIALYGDPILRKKGARIEEINEDIRMLVQDMTDTIQAVDGLGLAAPQVFRSLTLFITYLPIKIDEETWQRPLKVFINPKILSYSEETWTHSEACLSIPKVYGDVTRPYTITVEYTDLEGKRLTESFSEWPARVVLHENDHINGALYIDRMPAKERRELEPFLREIKKQYKPKAG